jgi:hypothetical protein
MHLRYCCYNYNAQVQGLFGRKRASRVGAEVASQQTSSTTSSSQMSPAAAALTALTVVSDDTGKLLVRDEVRSTTQL